MTAPPLATIGYEKSTLPLVVDALIRDGVALLLDIRAIPQSRKPGFSKHILAASLAERGLDYAHIRALGTPKAGREAARRGDIGALEAIFADHMASDEAQAGLALARRIAVAQRTCLLCFERDHRACHRTIVARLIRETTGQDIRHLEAELPTVA